MLPAQAEPTRGLKFEQRKEGLPEYPSESCDQGPAKPPKSPYFSPFPPRQGLLYLDLLDRLKSHGISYYADAVTPSVFVDVPVAEAVYVHRVPLGTRDPTVVSVWYTTRSTIFGEQEGRTVRSRIGKIVIERTVYERVLPLPLRWHPADAMSS